jgi:hypothetical protein
MRGEEEEEDEDEEEISDCLLQVVISVKGTKVSED